MSTSMTDARPFKRADPTDLRWVDPRPIAQPTTATEKVLNLVTELCGPESEVQQMLFGPISKRITRDFR